MRRLCVVVLLLTWPTTALACSVNDDYRAPTNVELIERADLVVLGRVSVSGPAEASYGSEIGLTPIRTLKGRPAEKLTLYGVVLDRNGKPIPPEPTDLDRVHSSSTWGTCDRQAYSPGTLVIATFRKRAKGYIQLIFPFARNVEDVEGPDALWVRAAARYAQIITENPPSQRRQAFLNERKRLLAQSGDSGAQAIAQDIARYLRVTATK